MRFPTPHLERARLLQVKDGDTLRLFVDEGRDRFAELDVRLRDVFAPESEQPGGAAVRSFVGAWLNEHNDSTDWPILLETFRTPRSDRDLATLSRFVGEVRCSLGHSLNAAVQAYITAQGFPGGVGS